MSQPHAPVRMPKYLQALIAHASLPLSLPFVQPVSFLNSALWSLPSAVAFYIEVHHSTSCLGQSHVIDPSVKLGSLITVISWSRSAAGVRELTKTMSLSSPHSEESNAAH